MSALAFWSWRAGAQLPALPAGWIPISALLISCYVAGLVCFAVGRWIRMGWRWRSAEQNFYNWFVDVLDGHGPGESDLVADYLVRRKARGDWRLYVRLWAQVRQSPALATSFSLLRRYWVMAATYDGVAMSLVVWAASAVACAFGLAGAKPIDKWLALPGAGVLMLCALACSREAGRFVDYQVEELVASIAADRTASNARKTQSS